MTTTTTKERIWSVDMLRGLIIALMAIDHIRDYWALTPFAPADLSQSNAAWFFTRWITHFCAPVFVFLAGTSAFLYGNKINDKGRLSRFLFTRGLWLIFIEVVVINFAWTFSMPSTTGFVFLQVIWVIAISMVLMSALIYLKDKIIFIIGLLLVVGHNLLDNITPESLGTMAGLWNLLHVQGFIPLAGDGSFGIFVIYPIIPWVGVMALGYVFGTVMIRPSEERRKRLLTLGLALVGLFVALRLLNVYGDPSPWETQERGAFFTFMDFLNTAKYPPSLLYLLMTLGPGILVLLVLDKWTGKTAEALKVFGAVPFFFYIIHFFIINAASQLYNYFVYGDFINLVGSFFSGSGFPEGYVPKVWMVYIVWALLMPLMYFLCKWYGQYKAEHDYWWLKYL